LPASGNLASSHTLSSAADHSLLWFGLMQEKLSPPLPPVDEEQFVRGVVDVVMTGIAAAPGV
jgi:hypothetical protein